MNRFKERIVSGAVICILGIAILSMMSGSDVQNWTPRGNIEANLDVILLDASGKTLSKGIRTLQAPITTTKAPITLDPSSETIEISQTFVISGDPPIGEPDERQTLLQDDRVLQVSISSVSVDAWYIDHRTFNMSLGMRIKEVGASSWAISTKQMFSALTYFIFSFNDKTTGKYDNWHAELFVGQNLEYKLWKKVLGNGLSFPVVFEFAVWIDGFSLSDSSHLQSQMIIHSVEILRKK